MNKIILLLSTVILIFLAACDVDDAEDEVDTVVNQNNGQKIDEDIGFAGITKQQCADANGHWNECGSPCAGTDADFCIEICQVQCGCGGIAGFQCPDGFKCRLSGKIADEIGICIAE